MSPVRLHWDLQVLRQPHAPRGLPPGSESLTWVSHTTTLLYGQRDAVLVATTLHPADHDKHVAWVDEHDRDLRRIVLTDPHPDHGKGLPALLTPFPHARVLPAASRATEVAVDEAFELEGHPLVRIPVAVATAVWVPALAVLIAGEAVADTSHLTIPAAPAVRQAWRTALRALIARAPRTVIAGTGPLDPDGDPRHLAATLAYLEAFEQALAETPTAPALYAQLRQRYPDHSNPGALWLSAQAVKPPS